MPTDIKEPTHCMYCGNDDKNHDCPIKKEQEVKYAEYGGEWEYAKAMYKKEREKAGLE